MTIPRERTPPYYATSSGAAGGLEHRALVPRRETSGTAPPLASVASISGVRYEERMRRLAFALVMLCATPALGAPRVDKLAVLPIIIAGPQGAPSLSSVIADVSASAELRVGVRLLSMEEMFVTGAERLGARVRDCGSDVVCIANRLRAFDARLGLVVVANLALEPALLSLQLLDTDDKRIVAQAEGELDGGQTLSAAIRGRADEIFDAAGYARAGRLVVDVSPPNAKVELGEGLEPDAGRGNVFTVVPGRYEVHATAEDHHPGSGVAVLTSGETARLELVLERETSLLGAWWLWTAIGVAVAGGTTAIVLATRPATRCLCTSVNGVGCEICE